MDCLNKSTLSEQIYNILREDIITQKIPCGEKLTLKILKERFQVSSTPIREALTRLSQDNLVEYYSNIGVNVVKLDEDDLREIYEFMSELDSVAVRYSARHPDREELCKRLKENLIGGSACLREKRKEEWSGYSDRFHLIFYEYCGNVRLQDSAARMRSQLTILSTVYESQEERQKLIQKEHEQIGRAYGRGDTEEAAELMRKHLMHSLEFAKECLKS
jgi:DNA-binding GntR family transcriptional regulator